MSARPFAVGGRVSATMHGGRRFGTVTRHDAPSIVWVLWDERRAPTWAHAASLRPEPDGIRETCWDCGESRECRPMVGSSIVDDGVPFCSECFAPHLRLSVEAEAEGLS